MGAEDQPEDSAVAYVLGALEADELHAAEARLTTEPAFRQAVDEARVVVDLLVFAPPPLTPSALVRQQLFARLDGVAPAPAIAARPAPPTAAAVPAGRPASRWRLRWWQPALAGAASLALLFGIATGTAQQELQTKSDQVQRLTPKATQAAQVVPMLFSPQATAVPLRQAPAAAAAEGRLVVDSQDGKALLLVRQLPPLPRDRTYQVWLAPSHEQRPMPVGLFQVDNDGVGLLALSLPVSLDQLHRLWVTVEPEEGSAEPTGQPVLDASL